MNTIALASEHAQLLDSARNASNPVKSQIYRARARRIRQLMTAAYVRPRRIAIRASQGTGPKAA